MVLPREIGLAGEPLEPRAHVVGQRRRAARVEAQLHGGRHLVDVLPARAGGADEAFLALALVDADTAVYDPSIPNRGR